MVNDMPYRIDIPHGGDNAGLDRLIALGALDVDLSPGGRVAAVLPDAITPEDAARALGLDRVEVSPAEGRDDDSVWVLTPRRIRVGSLSIIPAHLDAEAGAIRLVDRPAFGTGLHPTTALCLEAIAEALRLDAPDAMLDVGTGSGVLALGALALGVPRALAIDIDEEALATAGANARLNGLEDRLQLVRATADAVAGRWPLVVANILTAPLIEMAPALSRRVGHHGRLILSGIRASLQADVVRAYRDAGMHSVGVTSREDWVAVILAASW
jgi:ribosomal protein L11 methyltransferase